MCCVILLLQCLRLCYEHIFEVNHPDRLHSFDKLVNLQFVLPILDADAADDRERSCLNINLKVVACLGE